MSNLSINLAPTPPWIPVPKSSPQPQTLAPGPVPSPNPAPGNTLILARVASNTYPQPSNRGTSSGLDRSAKSQPGRLYPRLRAQPQPAPGARSGRRTALRSVGERLGRTKANQRARAGGEGTGDHPAAMRCFELPGPTLPASEPRTHSSPSPGLLRPRRAGCRRAGDASCRAQGSPRPPPSAQLGLGLQLRLRLRLRALLGFSAGHCLSSLPTHPSSLTPPQPFSPRPPSLSRSRSYAALSFPPSLLSPPPFPSLSLRTSAAFPDSAQARASAWL